MAWHVRVLVIANVTATSPDLLDALQARAERGPIEPTLLMPATGNGFAGREEAQGRLDEALDALARSGLRRQGHGRRPRPRRRRARDVGPARATTR